MPEKKRKSRIGSLTREQIEMVTDARRDAEKALTISERYGDTSEDTKRKALVGATLEMNHIYGRVANSLKDEGLYGPANRIYKEALANTNKIYDLNRRTKILEETDRQMILDSREYLEIQQSELNHFRAGRVVGYKRTKRIYGQKTLEDAAAATAIIGIIGGLLFFSSNLTGNVIGSQDNTNFIGLAFILIGIIGAFFWIKMR
jgi:hypothetical protein